jgi:hypothetical protein
MFFNRSMLRLHEADMNSRLMLMSSCLEKNWLIYGPASELEVSIRPESVTDVSSDSCSHMYKDSSIRDSDSHMYKDSSIRDSDSHMYKDSPTRDSDSEMSRS